MGHAPVDPIAAGRLALDHLGAQVAQDLAGGPAELVAEIDDARNLEHPAHLPRMRLNNLLARQ